MEISIDTFFSFIESYWGYAASVTVAYFGVVLFIGHLTSPSTKETLTLWLWGDYESTWAQQFCRYFNVAFGEKHFSFRCFWSSSLASISVVILLYVLFGPVTGLLDTEGRVGINLSIGDVFWFGAIINIIPDYISLYETRWLINRFSKTKSFWGQLLLLLIDAILTAVIILVSIYLYIKLTGMKSVTVIEMVAFFSVFSIFFYSTFLSSVWAWVYCLSTWMIRVYAHSPLKSIFDTEGKPITIIATVSSAVVFLSILSMKVLFEPSSQSSVSVFDDALCDMFPSDICHHAARLTKDEKRALAYMEKSCEDDGTPRCTQVAISYFMRDSDKATRFLEKTCDSGFIAGCQIAIIELNRGMLLDFNGVKAFRALQNFCEVGSDSHCRNVIHFFDQQLFIRPDTKFKLSERYRKKCEEGILNSCANLGALLLRPPGVKVDEGISLLDHSCKRGSDYACFRIGGLMVYNRFGFRDEKSHTMDKMNEIVRLYKYCKTGDISGCTILGKAYFKGVSK